MQVLDSNNTVKFTDLAGNVTEITLKQKDRKKSLSAELLSLSYNGKLTDITKNRFSFSWAFDKKGVLKVLIQHVLTNKNFSLVSAIFDGRNTRVLNLNQRIKPETKTYQGLKLINIKSNQGKLLWEIK